MQIPVRVRVALVTLSAACLLAQPASAIVISIWDFDGNNHPSASSASAGGFTVGDASFGQGPYQGTSQGILSTVGGVTAGAIESGLGLGSNDIRQLFNKGVRQPGFTTSRNNDVDLGSAFQITFDALAGDVLEFDWNMLTNETVRPTPELATYTDFAWYQLGGAESDSGTLANVNDGGFFPVGATAFDQHTGAQTAQITLNTGGTYTITVGVNDVADADDAFASALMVDFYRLVRGPEPGTFGTVAGGLMALSWLSRRRQCPRAHGARARANGR